MMTCYIIDVTLLSFLGRRQRITHPCNLALASMNGYCLVQVKVSVKSCVQSMYDFLSGECSYSSALPRLHMPYIAVMPSAMICSVS